MKKKIFSLLAIFALILGLLPAHSGAEEPAVILKTSGNAAFTPLTELKIAQMMVEAPLGMAETVFEETPSLQAPHSAGKLTEDSLQLALNRLNLLRRLAGLPRVEWSEELNTAAQHGAVLLAGTPFSHQPEKPEEMSQEFYDQAISALAAANLAGGVSPSKAVDLFMSDSDILKDADGNVDEVSSNLALLGHRRWQLSPLLGKVGFGYAYDDPADDPVAEPTPAAEESGAPGEETEPELPRFNYRHYVVEQVLDTSAEYFDYDFIGWPASGKFPNDVFNGSTAWSISLNEEKYQDPVKEELTVTLSRADETVWIFKGDETYSVADGNYFNVEYSAYGISNCIIFRPENIENYDGVYRVEVQGLKDLAGNPAEFVYEVDFFDADDYITDQTHVCSIKRFRDIEHNAWYHNAIEYVVERQLMNGTDTTTFSPSTIFTRAMIVQVLYNREGKPPVSGHSFTDVKADQWYSDAVAWSAANSIVAGFVDSTFRPDVFTTRQQIATILYRYAAYEGYDISARGDLSAFADGDQVADWAKDAMQWAVASGLMRGNDQRKLNPSGTATRAEVATILMNYCKNVAK